MKKPDDRDAAGVKERAELYFSAHPRSPSALRHPQISNRSGVWVVLLGESIPEGIAGFGFTVEAALRAFDLQYLKTRQPRMAA